MVLFTLHLPTAAAQRRYLHRCISFCAPHLTVSLIYLFSKHLLWTYFIWKKRMVTVLSIGKPSTINVNLCIIYLLYSRLSVALFFLSFHIQFLVVCLKFLHVIPYMRHKNVYDWVERCTTWHTKRERKRDKERERENWQINNNKFQGIV